MSDINVVIAGKQYRMACEDGQEDRLLGLASQFEGVPLEDQRKIGRGNAIDLYNLPLAP